MAGLNLNTKRVQVDKANLVVVIAVSAAAFLTFFSLVAVKALWTQRSYQARVIHERQKAADQVEANIKAADTLAASYEQFVSNSENVIGGSATGSGERDGDNARIVLDALPSKYDFPALTSSIVKLASSQSVNIASITGVDDEIKQAKNANSPVPKAVDMPYKLSVSGNYQSIQNLIGIFEHSIRPFQMKKLTFTAAQTGDVTLDMEAKSFYQPEKSLQFTSKVVK